MHYQNTAHLTIIITGDVNTAITLLFDAHLELDY